MQLTTAVKGCGRALDPSSDHEDLREGTAVELPLWLLPRFTCEDWVRVKCVGLAHVLSLWASRSGRACSARDGLPLSASGMLRLWLLSSSHAATERMSQCVRPPPKHQWPARCSGCLMFCFCCKAIIPYGFVLLLCGCSLCQASTISVSCLRL